MGCIRGGEHGKKGVGEFAHGCSVPVARSRRPVCLGLALVKWRERGGLRSGMQRGALGGSGSRHRRCYQLHPQPKDDLRVAPAESVCTETAGAQVGSAGMTRSPCGHVRRVVR